MKKLAARFVAAADEVWYLHNRKGPECDFFRKFCEDGHYGGRRRPTNTRQGIYCCTPAGEFLASVNTQDPRAMARMLETALAKWRTIPGKRRYLATPPAAGAGRAMRGEGRYPAGGLVLAVYSRDLPRKKRPDDWRARAWNRDYAWFRRIEARAFLPEEIARGATHTVPEALVARIARFHLVDNVRGQTLPYRASDVKEARLETQVVAVRGTRVEIRMTGRTRTWVEGRWHVGGMRSQPVEAKRGFLANLAGRAVFDKKTGRFVAFELVAAGTRTGGTRYNARHDDLGPAPMGVALVLAGESPAERVAPAFFWSYGW